MIVIVAAADMPGSRGSRNLLERACLGFERPGVCALVYLRPEGLMSDIIPGTDSVLNLQYTQMSTSINRTALWL